MLRSPVVAGYLFINHMHGTTALVAAVHGSFQIQAAYQSICRAGTDLTCSYLCSEPYVLFVIMHLQRLCFAVLKGMDSNSASVLSDQGSKGHKYTTKSGPN